VPVLAHDDDPPARGDAPGASEEPPTDIGETSDVPVPADDYDDVPVLAHDDGDLIGDITDDDDLLDGAGDDDDAITESRTGWRVERFGPKAPDGKGRYWQWRTGRGKNRRAAYGGKVETQSGEYWQRLRA